MELHVYHSKRGLLRVSWGRVIDEESLRRHYDMLRNERYARNLKVITSADVEELAFPLTQEKMEMFRRWREEALRDYESITTAFYNLQPVPAAYISYFSEFFDSDKSCMRQFATEQAAMAWLMLGHEPKQLQGKPHRDF